MAHFIENAKRRLSPRVLAVTGAVTFGTVIPNAFILPVGYKIWEALAATPDALPPIALAALGIGASFTAVCEGEAMKRKDTTTNLNTNIIHLYVENPILAVAISTILGTIAGIVLDSTFPVAGVASFLNGNFGPIAANLIAKSALLGAYSCTMNMLLAHDKIDEAVAFLSATERRVHDIVDELRKDKSKIN